MTSQDFLNLLVLLWLKFRKATNLIKSRKPCNSRIPSGGGGCAKEERSFPSPLPVRALRPPFLACFLKRRKALAFNGKL